MSTTITTTGLSSASTTSTGIWNQLTGTYSHVYEIGNTSTYFNSSAISIEEFLKIEDKELQKYMYMQGEVRRSRTSTFKIDNNKKKGYYYTDTQVCQNLKGSFYKKTTLKEWIVYNKETKKITTSAARQIVFDYMVNDNFRYASLMKKFWTNTTKTLCKRIITGKIETLDDLMKYHRSYTYRNKNLDTRTIYRFLALDKGAYINAIEDPQNLSVDDIKALDIPHDFVYNRIRKLHSSELKQSREIYDKWSSEQSKKLARIKRQGNANPGSADVEISAF